LIPRSCCASNKNEALPRWGLKSFTKVFGWGRVPHFRPSVHPDFLWNSLALTNFMRLSLMKAAHASVVGAPCRKSGTMGRKRILSKAFAPLHEDSCSWLQSSCPRSSSSERGCAPSFSAHVRSSEHGAPVQGRGLRCCLQPQPRRWTCNCVAFTSARYSPPGLQPPFAQSPTLLSPMNAIEASWPTDPSIARKQHL
jgi:hypothetical protein